jgi:catechol 2,3-dioxygenase-like lactoylglutathione lyase family enzyme
LRDLPFLRRQANQPFPCGHNAWIFRAAWIKSLSHHRPQADRDENPDRQRSQGTKRRSRGTLFPDRDTTAPTTTPPIAPAGNASQAATSSPPMMTTNRRNLNAQERTVLDHVSLGLTDLERSRRFYDAALHPLGLVRLLDFEGRGSDCGSVPHPHGVEFPITAEAGAVGPSRGVHLCFRAPSRVAVRALHSGALAVGGSDDGAAGLRPKYHSSYYAAFVLDPDGHRIEAVCHASDAGDALA